MRAKPESIDGYFFEKGKSPRLFWPILGLLVAAIALTSKQEDPGVLAVGILLAVVSVYPFYFWLIGWSHGLPIWPVFAAVTGLSAAMPMVQDTVNLGNYTPLEIATGGMTMVGFVLLGTIVWLTLTSRMTLPPRQLLMVSRQNAVGYLFAFLAAGVLYQINTFGSWVNLPGGLMQVARGILTALSCAAIFVLAFQAGRGLLSAAQKWWLAALVVLFALFAVVSLLLAQAVVPLALAVFGYTLGRGRIAWQAALVAIAFVAIFHAGKFQMRQNYWVDGKQGVLNGVTFATLPVFFFDWLTFGTEELTGVRLRAQPRAEAAETSTLVERAGNMHMLLLVQQRTPSQVPYFMGKTYEPILGLLVPRFISSKKGISHAGNVLLSVNYGLQTLEGSKGTSIYWGLVAEAYANFGYAGVAGLAIVLGIFYAIVGNLTVGVPMTSLRFVLALLIMGAATRADTMGVFVTSQFQGIIGASLAALVLMQRQRNPIANQTFIGGPGSDSPLNPGRPRGRRWESWQPENRGLSGQEERAAMKQKLAKVYGRRASLPRWASFRQRAIMMEITKLEQQLEMHASAGEPQAGEVGETGQTKDVEGRPPHTAGPADEKTEALTPGRPRRPRQVAVPYRNYRGYRSDRG